MRWRLVPSILAVALLGTSVAYAAGFSLSAPPKIAMLMFADINDGGWTQAFEEARVKMQNALTPRSLCREHSGSRRQDHAGSRDLHLARL